MDSPVTCEGAGPTAAPVAPARLPLYRSEALAARSATRLGRPIALMPTSWTAVTALLVLALTTAIIFLNFIEYSRIVRLDGVIAAPVSDTAGANPLMEIDVPAVSSGMFVPGQSVTVTAAALAGDPGSRLAGVIRRITLSSQPAESAGLIRLVFEPERISPVIAARLHTGMTLAVEAPGESRSLASWFFDPLRKLFSH
jgi:hypothetical protein